jgi:hypothetical protein
VGSRSNQVGVSPESAARSRAGDGPTVRPARGQLMPTMTQETLCECWNGFQVDVADQSRICSKLCGNIDSFRQTTTCAILLPKASLRFALRALLCSFLECYSHFYHCSLDICLEVFGSQRK